MYCQAYEQTGQSMLQPILRAAPSQSRRGVNVQLQVQEVLAIAPVLLDHARVL